MKNASLSEVVKILDNPRTVTDWVVRAEIGEDGRPVIQRIARIAWVFPRDGAGRLRVALTDWGHPDKPAQYVGSASGWGYDKMTAALVGGTIAGIPLGDHCDPEGRRDWRGLIRDIGAELIGGGSR